MCGIAGYAGIPGGSRRDTLVWALGLGIDKRGGHAAGYVTVGKSGYVTRKTRLGHWLTASNRFLARAARGQMCMMHARYATCGKKVVEEAHPFMIERPGHTIWGMHNGMIDNAWESAIERGRDIDVDSQEIFHCIADDDIESLQKLEGYGVITWADSRQPGRLNLARLSEDSEIHVASLYQGGIVWGSTDDIVDNALSHAGYKKKSHFRLDVGQVYHLRPDGIFIGKESGYTVQRRKSWGGSLQRWMSEHGWGLAYDDDDDDDKDDPKRLLGNKDDEDDFLSENPDHDAWAEYQEYLSSRRG